MGRLDQEHGQGDVARQDDEGHQKADREARNHIRLGRKHIATSDSAESPTRALPGSGATLPAPAAAGATRSAVALLHGPRLLILDEPFESVDPVSAATVQPILADFVRGGGTIVMSSHVMSLVEQSCDRVAVMAEGQVVASGPLTQVQGDGSLEQAFAELVGVDRAGGLSWIGSPR